MDQSMRQLVFGGLLHDVGKICYRAGRGAGNHSRQGAEFLAPLLPEGEGKQAILDCVRYHHARQLKGKQLEPLHPAWLVYEADNIAAGTDRRENEGEEGGFDREAPLESVFNRVKGPAPQEPLVFPLRGLGQEAGHYPQPASRVKAGSDRYEALLQELESNLRRMDWQRATPNELLKVLEAIGSYMPSSTNRGEACDISLYDHLKLTAALAACMKQYLDAAGETDYARRLQGAGGASFREEEAFLLVSGDLSGIQDFIYTIPSDGALKSLRGRSFYLEFLLEHMVDELLDSLQLSRANLLYTGGGHFYLLAANTAETAQRLTAAAAAFNRWLLQLYGTSLYLQLAWQSAAAADWMNLPDAAGRQGNRTGDVFRQLSAKLAQGKLQRYDQGALQELFDPASDLNALADDARECVVCKRSSRDLLPQENGSFLCPNCAALKDLGRRLLGEQAVFAVSARPGELPLSLPGLDGGERYLHVLSPQAAEALHAQGQCLRVYVKNILHTGSLLGTHLWVGDYYAQDGQGKALEFEELARRSGGIERLGVLRADVDNLGAAFVAGFLDASPGQPGKYVTLSRTATLSRQLSLFFKGYINQLCAGCLPAQEEAFGLGPTRPGAGRQVSIVYAGGDDMFLVGAWDDILGLAVDLRRAFARYTGGRLSFSAGVGLFRSSYPVSQMARLTGELEAAAKGQPGKDALALFGLDREVRAGGGPEEDAARCRHVYPWQVFAAEVCLRKLGQLRGSGYFTDDQGRGQGRALLYRLKSLLEDSQRQGRIRLARLAYALARLEPGAQAPEAQRAAWGQFRDHLYRWGLEPQDRQQLLTAMHLLIYSLRESRRDAAE